MPLDPMTRRHVQRLAEARTRPQEPAQLTVRALGALRHRRGARADMGRGWPGGGRAAHPRAGLEHLRTRTLRRDQQ